MTVTHTSEQPDPQHADAADSFAAETGTPELDIDPEQGQEPGPAEVVPAEIPDVDGSV